MSAPHLSAFSTILASFGRAPALALAMMAAWQRRKIVGQLGGLDDHMLRDIGITRQDVASSLSGSLFRDPSEDLARRAHEARRSHRVATKDLLKTRQAAPDDHRQAA